LRNRPNKLVYDITFALRFLLGMQMATCEQIRIAYTPWWMTILVTQVCAQFHVIPFLITLKYCLSTVVWVLQNTSIAYRQWKIKTLVSAQKSLIDGVLPETELNLASSLAPLTI